MGFFSDLKEDLNHAVNDLRSDDKKAEGKKTMPMREKLPMQDDEETLAQLSGSKQVLQKTDETRGEEFLYDPVSEPETSQEINRPAIMIDFQPKAVNEKDNSADDEAGANVRETMTDSEAGANVGEEPADDEVSARVEEIKNAAMAIQGTLESLAEKASENRSIKADTGKEVREAFGSLKEGSDMRDYLHEEAIRSGGGVIDKSWVLDLKKMEVADETAVITTGMRVKGDILSNGSADVFGEIQGNVQVGGKLNVTGKILGNSKAKEIFADSAKINGDLISDGAVKIGAPTVVIGNIEATSAEIAGAVKGTIDVRGPVILDTTAVVLGNVRAKSMQINNGARIEGMCVLCYAEQSAAKFFEEQDM